jgi:hypothetical protein
MGRSIRGSWVAAVTCLVAIGGTITQLPAQQSFTFSPPGGAASFETGTNWNPVGPPGLADTAVFTFDDTYSVLFDSSCSGAT